MCPGNASLPLDFLSRRPLPADPETGLHAYACLGHTSQRGRFTPM